MSLLKELMKENAAAGATSAHAIATAPGSLFGGGTVDLERVKKRKRKMIRRVSNITEGIIIYENLGVRSEEDNFSSADVISKMNAAEKKANAGEDTTTFGLEDEAGNIVRVYVRSESAKDFEKALAALLAGNEDDEEPKKTEDEIAGILFKLINKFEIVDVEWPTFKGDEEEEQEVEGEDDTESDDEMGAELSGEEGDGGDDAEADASDEEADEMEADASDEEADDMEADTSDRSVLDKVIDMLKADAEAKKADAESRTAEADAKKAESIAKAAAAKVAQEEQILDMEAYNKDKADQEKEAKQLAKLAKFQHDKAKDAEATLSMESVKHDDDEDDDEDDDHEISTEELADLILHNLRRN